MRQKQASKKESQTPALCGRGRATISLGFVSCSDDDDDDEEETQRIENTYEFSSLYGKTFSYSGTTTSGSAMTQTITVTDSETISWSMTTSGYPHGFDFTSCTVENTAADEWTVTGSYTYNGNENSVTMVFSITDEYKFNWTYNGKTYEGFELDASTFYGTYKGTWNVLNNDYEMTVIVAENTLYYASTMKGAFSVVAMASIASPAELTKSSSSINIPSDTTN